MSLEDTIRRIAENPLPANEEAAKFHAIVPVLKELGWDVYNQDGGTEVEYERPVGPGRGQKKMGRADIALMREVRGKKECAILIEAKAPPKKLEDHIDQLIEYAFHEGVDICVLTDSQKWWLYLPMQKGRIADRRFTELDIKVSHERVADELEQFLGRDNVLSGSAERGAKKRLKALQDVESLNTNLPKLWNQMQSEPDQGLIEIITQRASEEIGLRPSPEQVKRLLEGSTIPAFPENAEHIPSTKQMPAAVPSSKSSSVSTSKSKNKTTSNTSTKPGHVIVMGERHEVNSYADILFSTVRALHNKYGDKLRNVLSQNMKDVNWLLAISKIDRYYKKRDNLPYWVKSAGNAVTCVWKARHLLESAGESKMSLKMFDTQGNEIEEAGNLVLLKK